jgi:hypothetical protein
LTNIATAKKGSTLIIDIAKNLKLVVASLEKLLDMNRTAKKKIITFRSSLSTGMSPCPPKNLTIAISSRVDITIYMPPLLNPIIAANRSTKQPIMPKLLISDIMFSSLS